MKVLTTVAELAALDHESKRGAVLTMGALHQGHVALMQECRRQIGAKGTLFVSIFVNPTQFNDSSDLEKYPRTLEADLEICEAAGVDVVFAPTVEEIYPPATEIKKISAGALGEILEGKSRKGHFDGVATVVHRLLEILQADVTCFGQKDFQQIAVVRAMLKDTNLHCELVEVETVRDADGVALSSRNQRLSPADRQKAVVIPQSIALVARALEQGRTVDEALESGMELLKSVPDLVVDYLTVRSMQLDKPPMNGPARILIAANLGGVRLLDNCAATIKSGS
jgi:pantoate--beta-alanine ligase